VCAFPSWFYVLLLSELTIPVNGYEGDMKDTEKFELLKAALTVAVADGRLSSEEVGFIRALAAKAGVGQESLKAMIERAQQDGRLEGNILIRSPKSARIAVELLVAEARIDGEIADAEREILVNIATSFNITGSDFQQLYTAGLNRADQLRKSRQGLQ
jgi:uncharacterized tellurite resistance protein B-like protein